MRHVWDNEPLLQWHAQERAQVRIQLTKPSSWKCFWTSWLFAWVTIVFLPSAILAVMSAPPLLEIPKQAFDIADEISPLAKLLLGAGLAIVFLMLRKFDPLTLGAEALSAVFLTICILTLVLAFIPASYSRGFGIGLTGQRFSFAETSCFLIGSIVAGLLFCLLKRRCANKATGGEASP